MQRDIAVEGLIQEEPLLPVLQNRTLWAWLATASVSVFVWQLARSDFYTAGDGVGYYLGLVGGSMTLVLFLYPLRKRVRGLDAMGPIKHWFSLHMLLGIAGPTLVLLHSKFHLGSLNASIAFWSMLLVAGSGIVGRFLYRRVHHGLFGRQASLEDLKARAGINTEQVRTWLSLIPEVETLFAAFSKEAEQVGREGLHKPLRFLALGFQAQRTARRARAVLHQGLHRAASERRWDAATLQRRLGKGENLIRLYLSRAQSIAQFTAYERLFALWHILHLPFVYMLVFSAIAHVIAVHMY
jgi:hypothetical protein